MSSTALLVLALILIAAIFLVESCARTYVEIKESQARSEGWMEGYAQGKRDGRRELFDEAAQEQEESRKP